MSDRILRRARDQRGVTLAEAMITAFVLSLVLLAFYASFDSAQKTSGQLDARLEHLGEAQKLIRVTSKDIRTATPLVDGGTPFALADARELIFYARLDQGYGTGTTAALPAPERVRLWVDSSNPRAPVLKEETKEADSPLTSPPTYAGSQPVKLRLIGTYIYNTVSEPIFSYYDVAGTLLGPLPLDATNQLRVRSIGIRLKVKKSTALGVKPTTVETTVRLPNVIYGVAPGT